MKSWTYMGMIAICLIFEGQCAFSEETPKQFPAATIDPYPPTPPPLTKPALLDSQMEESKTASPLAPKSSLSQHSSMSPYSIQSNSTAPFKSVSPDTFTSGSLWRRNELTAPAPIGNPIPPAAVEKRSPVSPIVTGETKSGARYGLGSAQRSRPLMSPGGGRGTQANIVANSKR